MFIVMTSGLEFNEGVTGRRVKIRPGAHIVQRISHPGGSSGHALQIAGTDYWLAEKELAPYVEGPGASLSNGAVAVCFSF